MDTTAIAPVNGANGQPVTRAAGGLGKDDFLKLLVTQLRHQDPMKPMEDREFITQLAQLNAVEQMQEINANLKASMLAQDAILAASLLGRTVEVAGADGSTGTGKVTQVSWLGGTPTLVVDEKPTGLDKVISVR